MKTKVYGKELGIRATDGPAEVRGGLERVVEGMAAVCLGKIEPAIPHGFSGAVRVYVAVVPEGATTELKVSDWSEGENAVE